MQFDLVTSRTTNSSAAQQPFFTGSADEQAESIESQGEGHDAERQAEQEQSRREGYLDGHHGGQEGLGHGSTNRGRADRGALLGG